MADEKVRLGGMALPNGVLVHGPTAWACAIRTEDGRIEVAAERKRFRAANVRSPLWRGRPSVFAAGGRERAIRPKNAFRHSFFQHRDIEQPALRVRVDLQA